MNTSPVPENLRQPFRIDSCEKLQDLPRILMDRGYVESELARTLGGEDIDSQADLAAALLRTESPSAYHTLVRLFLLARSLPEAAVAEALKPLRLSDLIDAGLLFADAGGIRAQAALIATDNLLLARDFWPEFAAKSCPEDYVLGVGPASVAVAEMTVRSPVASALDIGTGSGYQALRAAGFCDSVAATDINPRALNFAAFNAKINGISNVSFHLGSLFEPLGETRFDLVVSNPPFVISPGYDFEYRDNRMDGDQFCEAMLRGVPARMREGAFCTILFNWWHQTDADWSDRPRSWVSKSGCDAWLVHAGSQDPLDYAAGWLRRQYGSSPDQYRRHLTHWLAYFDRCAIGKIGMGTLILRKRDSARNWFHTHEKPDEGGSGSCSDQILRIFAAHDLLDSLSDDRGLLAKAFTLAPDHQLEHMLHMENGRWSVVQARITQNSGLRFTGNVDRLVADLLAGCDGRKPLAGVLSDLAAQLRLEVEKIIPQSLAVMKKLLENGFLTIAG
jgi:SAM-dependent methyltransferase